MDLALEEIAEKTEVAEQLCKNKDQSKMKKAENATETIVEMRKISMETLGATIKRKSDSEVESEPKKGKQRRSGSDRFSF